MEAQKHLELLGHKAKDVVTGFNGVITSVCFDLYGCVTAVVTPPVNDGKAEDGRWFDVARLELEGSEPVMPAPDFAQGYIAKGKKGCAEKPVR